MPLDGRKGSKAPPLKRMEMEDEETQLMIRVINRLRNLKRVKVSLMKLHPKRSYTFSKSILIAMLPPLPLFLNMEWIISCTIMALSTPFCPGTKAVWRGETKPKRIGLNLATIILETIL